MIEISLLETNSGSRSSFMACIILHQVSAVDRRHSAASQKNAYANSFEITSYNYVSRIKFIIRHITYGVLVDNRCVLRVGGA